jgi:ribosome-binding protein aMBF1 (putative translation factor)
MSGHINTQIIRDPSGNPLYAVIPYADFIHLTRDYEPTIPNDVVWMTVDKGFSLIRAWREFKGLSQEVVAGKMGISQAAYSQMERPKARLRKTTLEKIASAMDVEIGQLKI